MRMRNYYHFGIKKTPSNVVLLGVYDSGRIILLTDYLRAVLLEPCALPVLMVLALCALLPLEMPF